MPAIDRHAEPRVRALSWAGAVTVMALLGSCAGGSSNSSPNPVIPPGFYGGVSSNGETVGSLFLADGSFWLGVLHPSNPADYVTLFQGQGVSRTFEGTLVAGSVRAFELPQNPAAPGAPSATLQGTWDGTTLLGTLTQVTSRPTTPGPSPSTTQLTSTTSFTLATSPWNVGSPNLGQLMGNYSGLALVGSGGGSFTYAIDAGGNLQGTLALSASAPPSLITGTVTPRTDVNAFDVQIAAAPGDALLGGQTALGLGYWNPTTNSFGFAVLGSGSTVCFGSSATMITSLGAPPRKQ